MVGGSEVMKTALDELVQGISSIVGINPVLVPPQFIGPHILLAASATDPSQRLLARLTTREEAAAESFVLAEETIEGGASCTVITGDSDAACLYAVFEFLREVQTGHVVLPVVQRTANRLRMIDHWDNLDGSVERGYAGSSIFFRDGCVTKDLERVGDYARLLSSIGVNAVAINNVNVTAAAAELITPRHLPDLARVAEVFRRHGIRLWLSVSFASPILVSSARSADPLDRDVREWWRTRAQQVYQWIPDLGGFVVKADSESLPGPHVYGRTQAEGANVIAAALRPFGGAVAWRAFIYDCDQDWRDRTTDRARAASDTFVPLDGGFDDNVILQIKQGPVDFQVREPHSPLLNSLRSTNMALEVQISQEYTGQQKDLCFLLPQWHEILGATVDMLDGSPVSVADVVSGRSNGRELGGVVGVANVGDDPTWTGHVLAQANLYAFGRLAWEPNVASDTVAREWAAQTFGNNDEVLDLVSRMLLASWRIYENYTAPLGVGWMVTPGHHYGPDVDGYEYSRWGTYHFADRDGVGVDRTVGTGSGYTAQYGPTQAQLYDNVSSCPDELLLFFHHVGYGHRLKSGSTVIQHIYDSHFEGVEGVEWLLEMWNSLKGPVGALTWDLVQDRLHAQLSNALRWRDTVNTYFYRKSGRPDEKGRAIFR
jgi:alpha-glucuronidase